MPPFNALCGRISQLLRVASAARVQGEVASGQRLILVADRGEGFWTLTGDPQRLQASTDPVGEALEALQRAALTTSTVATKQ